MIEMHRLALAATAGFFFCAAVVAQDEQQTKPAKEIRYVKVASLGIKSRAPSRKEVKELGLKWEVRAQGQIVTEVSEDDAAAKAGIQKGDVLLQLDDNEIFSLDDIADFLRVSKPGQKVDLRLWRAKNSEQETLSVSLGSKQVRAASKPELEWQFASLGQLAAALAEAKNADKLLLVGLSGAET